MNHLQTSPNNCYFTEIHTDLPQFSTFSPIQLYSKYCKLNMLWEEAVFSRPIYNHYYKRKVRQQTDELTLSPGDRNRIACKSAPPAFRLLNCSFPPPATLSIFSIIKPALLVTSTDTATTSLVIAWIFKYIYIYIYPHLCAISWPFQMRNALSTGKPIQTRTKVLQKEAISTLIIEKWPGR